MLEESSGAPMLAQPAEFGTREGVYEFRVALDYGRTSHTFSRPASANVGYALGSSTFNAQHNNTYGGYNAHLGANNGQVAGSSWTPPPKLAFLDNPGNNNDDDEDEDNREGLVALNYGREIFVYPYNHLPQSCEVGKPQDRRIYKGTCPTCHDFGTPIKESGSDCDDAGSGIVTPFIIGFSGGQVQMLDPVRRDMSKLFNEERLIEKTRVTCIKWIPSTGSALNSSFLVSYASGNLYLYNVDLPNPGQSSVPSYQIFKQGSEGDYSVFTCKAKSSRNPVYKWQIGRSGTAINDFAFSPCGHFLAIASQDGYMRLFNYDTMELTGRARSYFGGFRCLTWSPDGKLILLGGEDDLVTVFSVIENRVIVRGRGHKSWVSSVAFDAVNFAFGGESIGDALDFSASDEDDVVSRELQRQLQKSSLGQRTKIQPQPHLNSSLASTSSSQSTIGSVSCYRFGSVGEDTLLCLWDLSDDILKQSAQMHASMHATKTPKATDTLSSTSSTTASSSSTNKKNSATAASQSHALPFKSKGNKSSQNSDKSTSSPFGSLGRTGTPPPHATPSLSQRLASSLSFSDRGNKEHKRNFSLPSRGSSSNSGSAASSANAMDPVEWVQLGSPQCPRLHEVPMMEPLVLKRVAMERLTSLVFRPDSIVLACQDGWVHFWSRPERSNEAVTNGSTMGAGTIV